MSKGKPTLFRSIHTIINLLRPDIISVVLPSYGDGNCMNLCRYSVLAFAVPKFNLCLGCGQILRRYSFSLAYQLSHYHEYYSCKYSVHPCPPNKVFLVCGCMNRLSKSYSNKWMYNCLLLVQKCKNMILSPLPYFTLPIKWCISGRHSSGGYYFWLMSVY